MNTLTVKFRNAEEAARCDLTRLGNVAAASEDGLTVRVEDVDLAEWAPGRSRHVETDQTLGVIRAAMAACGVWAEVST
ncbi:MAG: hypothetical protein ABIR39_12200 [Nocardioides sp.]|uniref:hypothetical protein n=1 Tax=Nocardioides sp. TaxID=35761 RepID=UPI003266F56A